MFAYPPSAEVNRPVPKTKIYANTRVSKRVKELFASQVSEIIWRYKLSPETIHLPARNGIREIQVFEIRLKAEGVDEAVRTAIDKAIPFPLVIQVASDAAQYSEVSWKRPNEADPSKWVVEGRFRSDPQPSSSALEHLPVSLDLAGLYEQIIKRHITVASMDGESLADLVARFFAIQSNSKAEDDLKRRLSKEKQFNRKVELNQNLRNIREELSRLTASPNQKMLTKI